MKCSKCGSELVESSQRYCHICGSLISFPAEGGAISRSEFSSPQATLYRAEAGRPYSSMQREDNKQSVMILVFSLVSLGLGAVSLILSIGLLLFTQILGSPMMLVIIVQMFITTIVILAILHIVGVIFGVLSRKYSTEIKFKRDYPMAYYGSILSIFGIILNVSGLVTIVFLTPFIFNLV